MRVPPSSSGRPKGEARFLSRSANLSRWYFPGRGLGYSLFFHAIALVAILIVPGFRGPQKTPPRQEISEDKLTEVRMVMFLPSVGGGGQGSRDRAELSGEDADSAPSSSTGLTYPGPQWIRSDPPRPTSQLQTLLQPDLHELPILSERLDLPNLVLMPRVKLVGASSKPDRVAGPPDTLSLPPREAAAELGALSPRGLPISSRRLTLPGLLPMPRIPPLQASLSADPAAGLADPLRPEEAEPLDPSKGAEAFFEALELEELPLLGTRADLPGLVAAPQITLAEQTLPDDRDSATSEKHGAADLTHAPQLPPAQSGLGPLPLPIDLPDHDFPSLAPNRDTARSVLSLSPQPASLEQGIEIPAAEVRGQFSISPKPNLSPTENEPGYPSTEKIAAPSTEYAAVVTVSFGHGAAEGGGGAQGPGRDVGTLGAPEASETARAIGAGTGTGTGAGSGAGSGPGSGTFAGIRIIGGDGEGAVSAGAGADRPCDPPCDRPLNAQYQLFVLSTEKSGGGLPYFGVFPEQRIRTVFLDLRRSESAPPLVCTFEFGVPREADQWAFELPTLSIGEYPTLPEELVSRHLGKMIILFAVVNLEGKMEQISIKESPEIRLNLPMIDALAQWVFRPGKLRGKPVAVKTLLGIPLSIVP